MAEEIAKTGSVSMERPAFVPQGKAGTEHLKADDIKLPRLKIAQKTSPEIDKDNAAYIKGLEMGDYFNDVSQENYGRGPLTFTVVRGYAPKFIEFEPRGTGGSGGGVRDMNVPAGDPRTQFTRDAEGKSVKPRASKIYDFILVLHRADAKREMVTFSLASTGLKVATLLNAFIAERQADVYFGVYTMQAVSKTSPNGPYYTHVVRNAGWIAETEIEWFRSKFELLKEAQVDIRVDDADSFDPETLEH